MTLLDRLAQLDETVPSAPWHVEGNGGLHMDGTSGHYGISNELHAGKSAMDSIAYIHRGHEAGQRETAELIVTMRNLLPDIVTLVEMCVFVAHEHDEESGVIVNEGAARCLLCQVEANALPLLIHDTWCPILPFM